MKTYTKYRNRKIHEVGQTVVYVTSSDLVTACLSGPIRVLEYDTRKDVTSSVLSRLIYDLCNSPSSHASSDLLRETLCKIANQKIP